MLEIMKINKRRIEKSAFLLLFCFICNSISIFALQVTPDDSIKPNKTFPRYIQPFIGVFGDLNAEGSSSKLTNAGITAGAHIDFWRFHCTANLYRYNKLKNDIGFLDNVYNYDLKASILVTKNKAFGLSLIGSYDFGARPMVIEQSKDKGGVLLSNETGLGLVQEQDQKYFLSTQQPYYGLGFGFLVKNNRIKKDVSFCEISLRYLFVDKSSFSQNKEIELSPYNINVPQSYVSDGLKLKNRGVMFQVSLGKGFFGGSLAMGTRPLLYVDNVRGAKLKPLESSLLLRLSFHFKIL
jgi:hypothetical protein